MTQQTLEIIANQAVSDAGGSERNRIPILADIALSLRRIADALQNPPKPAARKKLPTLKGTS